MATARSADVDLAPALIVGVVGITIGAIALALRKPGTSSDASEPAPGHGGPSPGGPPGGRPPSGAPPGMTPPTITQAPPPNTSSSLPFNWSPLYLYIWQDGAGTWIGIGWFYGHYGTIADPHNNWAARDVWITPEGEIMRVLESYIANGVAGWFDTIEPSGVEDRNFVGRIEQHPHAVFFWVEADPSSVREENRVAHYEDRFDHHVQEYVT